MNLSEYQKILLSTEVDDWTTISCWGAGSGPSFLNKFDVWKTGRNEFHSIEIDSHSNVCSLKSNLLISVAFGLLHNDNFIEPWANKFDDKSARSSFIDFFYSGALVFRDIYVSVDGGRCILPLPNQQVNESTYEVERLTVSKDKAHFFRLLNGTDEIDYSSYLNRSGIEIIDSSWMV